MAKDTEPSDTSVPTNDAYTGMLAIALIALIAGCVLLFLDYSQYSGTPPKVTLPQIQKAPPTPAPGPPPAPAPAPEGKAPEAKDAAPMPGNPPMPMPGAEEKK